MPDDVPGAVVGAVKLRAQNSAEVADGDLHGVANGALCLARDVDGRPREHKRRGRVDPSGGEEGPKVGDPGPSSGVGVGEEDDVADGRDG